MPGLHTVDGYKARKKIRLAEPVRQAVGKMSKRTGTTDEHVVNGLIDAVSGPVSEDLAGICEDKLEETLTEAQATPLVYRPGVYRRAEDYQTIKKILNGKDDKR